MRFDAEVSVEKGVSADEIKEMEKVLSEINISPRIKANYYRKSFGDTLPWVLFLYISIRKYLDAFMAEAGKDCYKLLKEKLRKLYQIRLSRQGIEGSITIVDTCTKIQILLPADNPQIFEEAMEKLNEIDLRLFDTGPLKYDESDKKWKSILD